MIRIALVLCVGAAGCGESDLTCELLADPSNCWAEAAAATKACLPAPAEIAVFESDRTRCTFTDGTRIVFDEALPQRADDISRNLTQLAFTIQREGAACARFVDTLQNRMVMTAGGNTVSAELVNGETFRLSCSGGPTYSTEFSTLFDCAADGIPAPTDGFELTPTMVSFSISSVTTPGELFRCETP